MNNNMDTMFKRAIDMIKSAKSIYLASHVQPDGDNIGSLLGLALALKKNGKQVFVVKTDSIPKDFMFLPGIDLIKEYDDSEVDLFITVDSSDEKRLGDNEALLDKANKVINIDHHLSNTNYGDLNIVDSDAAATCEIVFKLIKAMDIEIDRDIATALYTGISTDTGSFMYDNANEETHLIAAELLRIGIDKQEININIWQNKSLTKTKLFIKTLETLETYFDDKLAVIEVTRDNLRSVGASMEDSEGIVSFVRDIDTVEVAVMLKEFEEDEIKVSMRSKKYVDVSKVCAVFGGGGHKKASGCTINSNLEKAKKDLIDELEKVI